MLLTTVDAETRAHFVVITAAAPESSQPSFVWSSYSVPFSLATGQTEVTDISLEGKWKPGEKQVGILLPPHTTIFLRSIELVQQNIFERGLEAARSFWVFDQMRPYSINFVWGPQIGWNASERAHLYDVLPPVYQSGTLMIYGILIVLIAAFIGYGRLRKIPRTTTVQRICVLLIGVWILLDARMGSEFLSWVWHDRETYIAVQPGERQFRDRDAFYDFADFAAPFVADRESYVFFAEYPWPYLGNMRYLTYPSIPGIDYMNDDTWVIYRRPDMGVDALGQMTIDGEAISPPGTILGRFDKDSFIFRLRS